jgi:hypothetical protein
MEENLEEALRRTLASQPRPGPSPTFVADVLEMVAWRQHAAEKRRKDGPGMLLTAYWLAAGVASGWVILALPWPSWGPPALWVLALTIVPVGFAVFLWPQPAVRWTASCIRALLADSPR